jgi:hypothetical protein
MLFLRKNAFLKRGQNPNIKKFFTSVTPAVGNENYLARLHVANLHQAMQSEPLKSVQSIFARGIKKRLY